MAKLELILDQLTKAENELKEINDEKNQLAFDYVEYSRILVKEIVNSN